MRRVISALVLLAAAIAMSTLVTTTDAQITFASMQKRRSRVRGSKRSIDNDDNDASRSSAKAAHQSDRGVGYSFADLPGISGDSTQKQSTSTTPAATSTISNDTIVKPLGKSQAAGVPLTPEVTTYSEDSDPKQSEPETASPTPSKAVTRTPASESLGKSPAAAMPVTSTPPTAPSDDTDPTQSDLETPSPAKTPATTSLGESQVAGHPVESTPAPAPPAATDDDNDDDEDDEDEDGSKEEEEDETPKPNTNNTASPKQSDV